MFCTQCGTKLDEGMAFCPSCGSKVASAGSVEETQVLEYPVAASQPVSTQLTQPVSTQPTQPGAARQTQYDYSSQPTAAMPGYPVQPAQAQPTQLVQPAQAGATIQQGVSPIAIAAGAVAAIVVIAALLLFFVFKPGQAQVESAGSSTPTAGTPAASTSAAPASSGASAGASTTTSAGASSAADAAKAQAEQLASSQKAAVNTMSNAGMQVFTGTVHVTTFAQRGSEKGIRDFERETQQLVYLELDTTQNIGGRLSGDMGKEAVRSGDSISFGNRCSSAASAYDGKHVTVAAYQSDLWFPSDVAGALYTVIGDAYVVYADGEAPVMTTAPSQTTPVVETEKPKPQPKPQPSSSSYVLPDSSSRAYSYSELSSLSNYQLYIARNEIYARHGRMFNRQDLNDYFNAQSWYSGRIAPENFDDGVLNSAETANIKAMREIEGQRNSPYL